MSSALSSADDRTDEGYVDGTLTEKKMMEIQEKLQRLPHSYLQKEDFNPFIHIIEFMKSSEQEQHMSDLTRYCHSMDKIRKELVDAYFQQFNKAIRNYTAILATVNDAKKNEDSLQEASAKAAILLRSKSSEVSVLYATTLEHDYMVKLLVRIEGIKQFPVKYSQALSQGQYIQAAKLLTKVYRDITKNSMRGIGALSVLSKRITDERENFHRVLVEVLHNFVYLKNKRATSIRVEVNDDGKPGFTRMSTEPVFHAGDNEKLAEKQDQQQAMHSIVNALFALSRGKQAINLILSRIRSEVRNKIEHVLKEGSENVSGPNDFSTLLKRLFKRSRTILANHSHVSIEFQKRFMKNDIAGSSTPRGKDRKQISSYTIDAVWEEFQKEFQTLIGLYIDAPKDSHTQQSISQSSSGPKLFSFAGSSAFTMYEEAEEGSFTYSDFHMALASPSPYKLTAIYPLVTQFDETVSRIAASSRSKKPLVSPLMTWMRAFVKNTFIPHIREDYSKRIATALDQPGAFQSRERRRLHYSAEEAHRPLLNSVVDIAAALEELAQDIIAIPDPFSVDEFQKIMVSILHNYAHSCQSVYAAATKGKESSDVIAIEKHRLHLLTDPKYRAFSAEMTVNFETVNTLFKPSLTSVDTPQRTPSRLSRLMAAGASIGLTKDDREEQKIFDTKEKQLEAPAYDGYRISTREPKPANQLSTRLLILDVSSLALLANFSDSLRWLVAEIDAMGRGNATAGPRPKAIPGFINTRPGVSTSHSSTSTSQAPQVVNVVIRRQAKILRSLSETCLVQLREELRLWCFTFLNEMTNTSYVHEVEFREPDTFVVELGTHLSRAYETLVCYLPSDALSYVFDSLPSLVTTLLVQSLEGIDAINTHGISKVKRDTYYLSQTFHQILETSRADAIDSSFDRVRKFYDLLNLTAPDLLSTLASSIAERSNPFSLDEVISVLTFLSPNKVLPPVTRNYLHNLFSETYLVNSGGIEASSSLLEEDEDSEGDAIGGQRRSEQHI